MEYLILALPRSRTSWLALTCNLGSTVPCLHEYISQGGDTSKIEGPFGACEINPYLDYPECKTVVIDRDPLEVAESLSFFYSEEEPPEGFIERECLLAHEKLLEAAKERDALVVKYEDINKRFEEILNHLGLETIPFHEHLKMYRVEPMSEDLDLIMKHRNFICK